MIPNTFLHPSRRQKRAEFEKAVAEDFERRTRGCGATAEQRGRAIRAMIVYYDTGRWEKLDDYEDVMRELGARRW